MPTERWLKALQWLVVARILAGFIYAGVGFVHPHVIRQTDTLGVSLRYALTWQFQAGIAHPLFPRSLSAGDHDGILSMELPVVNLLTAPAFFLPIEWARPVARSLLFVLFTLLYFLNWRVWRRLKILDMSMDWPARLLPLFAISGTYFVRFMPDFFSFVLCSLALGLSFLKPRHVASAALATLGLLIKPPTVVIFALGYFSPNFRRSWRTQWLWLIPALVITGLYYTVVVHYLQAVSDLTPYFKTELHNPWFSILEFLSDPRGILRFLVNGLFYPFAAVALLFALFLRKDFSSGVGAKSLWLILSLQILGVVLLDGGHALVHNYYFIGCSLTIALLFLQNLRLAGHSPASLAILILPLIGFNVEHMFYEVRPLWAQGPDSVEAMWQDCAALKKMTPDWPWSKGYVFHSEATPIPELGLCFGEQQGSQTSEFGVYLSRQVLPGGCQVVQRQGQVLLVRCQLVREAQVRINRLSPVVPFRAISFGQ